MTERIINTIRILRNYKAPENIVEYFNNLYEQLKYSTDTDPTENVIKLLRGYSGSEWSKEAIKLWVGNIPESDSYVAIQKPTIPRHVAVDDRSDLSSTKNPFNNAIKSMSGEDL